MKVAIIENIAPLYRLALWQKLSQVVEPEYHFFSSASSLNGIATINKDFAEKPINEGGLRWKFLRNIIVFRRLVWQTGCIKLVSKSDFDVYIMLGEMNIISIWISAIICKIRKRKVLFWGHGIYGDEGIIKRRIRLLFYRIPHGHLLYNERACNLLIKEGFQKTRLYVIYNSLNYDVHLRLRNSFTSDELTFLKKSLFPLNPDAPIVIFMGRLTREKKISQLIESIELIKRDGTTINCVIIGKGEEGEKLKQLAEKLKIENLINFYGPCYNERENAMLYSISDCSVSSGNVGLNAIHSLSFGIPVITHNDLTNQNPEVSAVIEGKTGEFFEIDNVTELAFKIKTLVFSERKLDYHNNCLKVIDDYYNPYNQVNIFNKAVREVLITNV
jgi:glycosyltransferase involved in cell wall biosynthesis